MIDGLEEMIRKLREMKAMGRVVVSKKPSGVTATFSARSESMSLVVSSVRVFASKEAIDNLYTRVMKEKEFLEALRQSSGDKSEA